jgi:hypothetical protein
VAGADTVRAGSRDDASRTPLVERRRKEPSPRTQKVRAKSADDGRRQEPPSPNDSSRGKVSAIRVEDQETTIGGPPEQPQPVFIPDLPASETQLGSDTEKELTAESSFAIDLPMDDGDSFVRRSAKKKQSSSLSALWAGLNQRQRHTVMIWGIIGAGTLVVLVLALYGLMKPAPEKVAPLPPPRPVPKAAIKRDYGPEIAIGDKDGLPTIAAALDYIRENRDRFTGDASKPAWTIKVPGGKVYDETIRVGNSNGATLPPWVTIVSDGESPAMLRPSGNGPVIDLEGVEKLTLRGFILEGGGREAVARLSGFLVGTRLENLELRDVGNVGIAWDDVAGLNTAPIQFVGLKFVGHSSEAVAVRMGDVRQLKFDGCRWIGPFKTGIEFSGSAWNTDVSIRHCVFHDVQTAIHMSGGSRDIQRIELVNNTFHRVQRGLEFDEMPATGSAGLSVHHNLFIRATGAEAVVRQGYAPDRAAVLLAPGSALNNWTDRPAAGTSDGSAELDVFAQGQRGVPTPAFASTDPGQPGFLKPTSPSVAIEVKSSAQGADPIVGAIAP